MEQKISSAFSKRDPINRVLLEVISKLEKSIQQNKSWLQFLKK